MSWCLASSPRPVNDIFQWDLYQNKTWSSVMVTVVYYQANYFRPHYRGMEGLL